MGDLPAGRIQVRVARRSGRVASGPGRNWQTGRRAGPFSANGLRMAEWKQRAGGEIEFAGAPSSQSGHSLSSGQLSAPLGRT